MIIKKKSVLLNAVGRLPEGRTYVNSIDIYPVRDIMIMYKVKYFTNIAFLYDLTVLRNVLILLYFVFLTTF